jgi:hypothetical protein
MPLLADGVADGEMLGDGKRETAAIKQLRLATDRPTGLTCSSAGLPSSRSIELSSLGGT